MSSCPCGSKLEFDACCGPYLAGALAPTAEALMRSRYTAHVRSDLDHIERTDAPELREKFNRLDYKRLLEETKYLGLEILGVKDGGVDDETGQVEYAYRYTRNGQTCFQQEVGNFVRENGAWLFKDSKINPKSGRISKTGRNDMCPCGSGKKFKKCCGA
jgi:SEC-C motif-containing protein